MIEMSRMSSSCVKGKLHSIFDLKVALLIFKVAEISLNFVKVYNAQKHNYESVYNVLSDRSISTFYSQNEQN